jgi:hypothetical protein
MNEEDAKNTIKRLRTKYQLKADTPFDKLPRLMTPRDHHDFMEAITFPNGKPSENVKNVPDHLKKVSNENLNNLRHLFRNTNFTKE